jgi:hypothetical protein
MVKIGSLHGRGNEVDVASADESPEDHDVVFTSLKDWAREVASILIQDSRKKSSWPNERIYRGKFKLNRVKKF